MTEVTNQGAGLGLVTARNGTKRSELKNSEKSEKIDKTEFNKTLNEKLEPSKPTQAQDEPMKSESTSVKIQEKKTQAPDKDSIIKEISQKNLDVLANKQQAVLDFMDSIESELGIPHEDLQEALAELLRSDPNQKVEDSAEVLFSYFNLSADQMKFAKTEFAGLHSKLKDLDSKLSSLPKSPELLQASLVDLSSRFFMKNNPQVRLSRDSAPMPSPDVLKGLDVKSVEMQAVNNKDNNVDPNLLLAGVNISDLKTKNLTGLNELFQATLGNENQIRVMNGQQIQDSKMAEQILNDFNKSLTDLSQVVQQKQGLSSYKDFLGSEGGESDLSDSKNPDNPELSASNGLIDSKSLSSKLNNLDSFKAVAGASGAIVAQPTANQAADNIRWVNQQVQQLVKQGGGESKIVMTPEGLGKLQLKVELQEGKVNISMAAEKAETMQMIEKSSHLLKEGLDKNNLELGKITFDKSLSTDVRNQDFGSDSKQFQDQARGFLGNFRDENFNRRQDWFYETPSMKAYRSQSIDAPSLKPINDTATNAALAYKTSKKGSGLDLVA